MDRPRVVLADDNKALLESVWRLLDPEFEVVATAADGQAAFDAVKAKRPDAIVLDISMPVAGGLDAAVRLSALPNPPRIVFLSVHESREFLDAARDAGASGYVFKRNACRDLISVLRQALAGERAFPQLTDEPEAVTD
jgi:DNA-binding NarL/FixJ family response regulator